MRFFIEAILPLSLTKTFTYEVTEADFLHLQPGMRVSVSFGKSKIYTALVYYKHYVAPNLYIPKFIEYILDNEPIVHEIQLKHWKWISEYYMCSLGEVYKTALPPGFVLESESLISLKETSEEFLDTEITDDEYLVIEALRNQTSIFLKEIGKVLQKKNVIPVVKKLLSKGIISLSEEVFEKYEPKLVKYIRLNVQYEIDGQINELLEELSRSPKQRALVLNYFQLLAVNKRPISKKELVEKAQTGISVLTQLIKKDVFEEYVIQEDRVGYSENISQSNVLLNEFQEKALEEIKQFFIKSNVSLLHGITGSGKTEIYIKLIEGYLDAGQQVLYLLPEISLTTQLVTRLHKYFGDKILLYHSLFNDNERVEIWNKVLSCKNEGKIVIGVRSALYLPYRNLGLIVVDEEHEQTFKQSDPAPRYNARDAAIVLAKYHGAKVLLGSATPSLETYFNCINGKYGYVELNKRYGEYILPEIHVVDLKDKYFRKKMTGHFSDVLIEKMKICLGNNEQVILFQNRRGYSPFVECLTCGHVPHCPHCDVSLTFYKYKNLLKCHYCSYTISSPSHCHSCQSIDLSTKGFGTEQIELELKELFPEYRIGRMDQDTTRGKYGYEKIIDAFKNKEIDILVGTQMLAKGLHFDNVTLAGILNADNLLNQPNFRAYERAFQMMVQVAGRAGRTSNNSEVVIQTYNPYHNTLKQVIENDYKGMYKEQIYERYNFKYPPYYRMIKLTFKHRDYNRLKDGAMWFYKMLVNQLKIPVLGPEEPAIAKIRNLFIRTIIIKIPSNANLKEVKETVSKGMKSFESIAQYRSIQISINVDPY